MVITVRSPHRTNEIQVSNDKVIIQSNKKKKFSPQYSPLIMNPPPHKLISSDIKNHPSEISKVPLVLKKKKKFSSYTLKEKRTD